MKNNNIIINAAEALKAVLNELHLNSADVEFYDFKLEDSLYEMVVYTTWMRYTCYVDAETGEVVGLSSEPMLLHPTEQYDTKFEFLYSSLNFIPRPRSWTGAGLLKLCGSAAFGIPCKFHIHCYYEDEHWERRAKHMYLQIQVVCDYCQNYSDCFQNGYFQQDLFALFRLDRL